MLEKTFKKVFTFNSTTDAIAFERACKNNDIPGRLIPVPRAISAGCGIAWCSPMEEKDKVPAALEQLGIEAEDMVECEI